MLTAVFRKTLPDFILNVDFVIEEGIIAVSGPSGAGKSTMLQCLAGLIAPDDGRIEMDETIYFSSEKKINLKPRLRNIGYVFQDYALFPHMTVEENVSFGISRSQDNWLEEVMELSKVSHLKGRYPRQISGGERQRVAIARALATKPELVLLDEPFSALDDSTRKKLRKELKFLQESWQIPFLLVTHNKSDLKYLADHVLVLNKGHVIIDDTANYRQNNLGGDDNAEYYVS